MFGLFLIIVGLLFLLQEFGWIQGGFWGYFWPIVIILFGLSLLKKKNGNECWCGWCFPHGKKKKKDHGDHHKVVDEQ